MRQRTSGIALAVRVRNEWDLLLGLLDSLRDTCDEAWILDDASETVAPREIYAALPRVVVLRAQEWSGEGGRLGEGLQRDFLLQRIRRGSRCGWVLQLDADERIARPDQLMELAVDADTDAWVLPLLDFYITPDDANATDRVEPGRVRKWFGPETRWTLCMFRPVRGIFVSRGVVREPQGFAPAKVRRTNGVIVEHYGKSVSVADWERKADFYIAQYPEYRAKWLERKGRAVHAYISDFGAPLLRRGDAYSPDEAPSIYEYQACQGFSCTAKTLIYGRLAPSLLQVAVSASRPAE